MTHLPMSRRTIFTFSLTLIVLAFALFALVPRSARASAPASTEAKVGIVNIQEAIASTTEGKKELAALQQRFGARSTKLKTRNDELEQLKSQLKTQGDKLSDTERGARIKAITDKQKSLQRDFDDFQAEVQQAEQQIINSLGQKMIGVLGTYAKSNGYKLVLDVSSPQTPVLWASTESNITKELVDAYNAQVGEAAPKPTTPAPTTPK